MLRCGPSPDEVENLPICIHVAIYIIYVYSVYGYLAAACQHNYAIVAREGRRETRVQLVLYDNNIYIYIIVVRIQGVYIVSVCVY